MTVAVSLAAAGCLSEGQRGRVGTLDAAADDAGPVDTGPVDAVGDGHADVGDAVDLVGPSPCEPGSPQVDGPHHATGAWVSTATQPFVSGDEVLFYVDPLDAARRDFDVAAVDTRTHEVGVRVGDTEDAWVVDARDGALLAASPVAIDDDWISWGYQDAAFSTGLGQAPRRALELALADPGARSLVRPGRALVIGCQPTLGGPACGPTLSFWAPTTGDTELSLRLSLQAMPWLAAEGRAAWIEAEGPAGPFAIHTFAPGEEPRRVVFDVGQLTRLRVDGDELIWLGYEGVVYAAGLDGVRRRVSAEGAWCSEVAADGGRIATLCAYGGTPPGPSGPGPAQLRVAIHDGEEVVGFGPWPELRAFGFDLRGEHVAWIAYDAAPESFSTCPTGASGRVMVASSRGNGEPVMVGPIGCTRSWPYPVLALSGSVVAWNYPEIDGTPARLESVGYARVSPSTCP